MDYDFDQLQEQVLPGMKFHVSTLFRNVDP
jgi:hypothetical protein